jgi:glutamate 5-kinase
MSQNIRKQIFSRAKKLVVKVGTGVLTAERGGLDRERMRKLADQIAQLRTLGYSTILVSSGAIGAGMAELRMTERPTSLPQLQAAAAVGQSKLMAVYDECLKKHGLSAAQILLTRVDFEDRTRYLNARNTIWALLRLGAVPIINENDTISVEEITFSDNDILSAFVTNLLRADALIILSVVDGVFRTTAPGGQQEVIDLIEHVDDEVKGLSNGNVSSRGKGGMDSKLEAAGIATHAGEVALVANGKTDDILLKIVRGEKVGTLFLPVKAKMASRKRWIGFTSKPKGVIHVDAGAAEALMKKGRSLLASGIRAVTGDFQKGDVVSIFDAQDLEIARGLVNYSSQEIDRIKGLKTSAMAKVLGAKTYDEVVHRDNLALLQHEDW